MKQLSSLTFVFAISSVVFLLLLIFFRTPFALYPLMSNQDALDLLTPLVLIPLYWLLFRGTAGQRLSLWQELIFMLLASVWVAGQGMHLSTNSVNNLAQALAKNQELNILQTKIFQLTYFFDEHLSHYLWHIGVSGLAVLLVFRDWRRPEGIDTQWRMILPSGLIYGFTLFCIFLEGQTVWLGLPFVTLVTLVVLLWGRQQLAQKPVLAFFFIACLAAFVLLGGWGLYWRGFPQFTEVGLI